MCLRGQAASQTPGQQARACGQRKENSRPLAREALHVLQQLARVTVIQPPCDLPRGPGGLPGKIRGHPRVIRLAGHGAEFVADRAQVAGQPLLLLARLLAQLALGLAEQVPALPARLSRDGGAGG